jgi:hypothetical protein
MFMKKAYLIWMLFCAGSLMAQNNTEVSHPNDQSLEKSRNHSTSSKSIVSEKKSELTTQSEQKIELPGFPVYVNTENKVVDDANYATAKNNWIKENGATYAAYQKFCLEKVNNLQDLPGFPQLINTGDAEKDKANYRAAKKLWIENNQDVYKNFRDQQSFKSSTHK